MGHRRGWQHEKHQNQCNAMRARYGGKVGDGLKWLAELKQGSEVEQELARTLEKMACDGFWSANFFDATLGMYHSIELRAKKLRRRAARDTGAG